MHLAMERISRKACCKQLSIPLACAPIFEPVDYADAADGADAFSRDVRILITRFPGGAFPIEGDVDAESPKKRLGPVVGDRRGRVDF
jgi:hypothetical protein